jgi:hypothetical protein
LPAIVFSHRAMISIGSVRLSILGPLRSVETAPNRLQGVGLARDLSGGFVRQRGSFGLRTAGALPMIVGRGIGLTCHRRRGADGQIATPTAIRSPKSAQFGRWAGYLAGSTPAIR